MRKENEEVQYIWHDGVRIREDQLISMAKRAGSYAIAEHYVCSLLAHGTAYGLTYIIDKVNEIREHYQVGAMPKPNTDDDNMVRPKYRISVEDQMRKTYRRMTIDERIELIRESLGSMIANYPKLFRFKNQWQGIYLVIRDRLDCGLSQTDFMAIAQDATPSMWPKQLEISENVIKNFGRVMDLSENEAYYELKYNPMENLCTIFWNIIKAHIKDNEV